MNALFSGTPATKVALYLLGASLSLGATGHAMAQTAQFPSEANSISGDVTKTVAGLLPQTTTISPVDQSITTVSGSNDQTAPSASQSIYGVEAYSFGNINNGTDDADTGSTDDGDGNATLGTSNLLGLVFWNSSSTPLNCKVDGIVQAQIDCGSQQVISGLSINGVMVAPGTYSAGAAFTVSGTIKDPNCGVLDQETFSGKLILQPTLQLSSIVGDGTAQGKVVLTGMKLSGTATCSLRGQVLPLFQTTYDIDVARSVVRAKYGIGGMMVWALDQDDDQLTLLNTVLQ